MPLPNFRPPSGWSLKTVPHLTPALLCRRPLGFLSDFSIEDRRDGI